MSPPRHPSRLPPSGPERERLRARGQFWTPAWVADAMVAYVLAGQASEVFDPAVGEGAFFRAVRRTASGRSVRLAGCELDPDVLGAALASGVSAEDLARVQMRDFVLDPPPRLEAVVANPPYLRHHRLSPDLKGQLKAFGREATGRALDARTGFHVFFLLRALTLLEAGGRLAFIVPADTVEGVSAGPLWTWASRRYALEGVVTFTPRATPFPGVDTNPVILLIRHAEPCPEIRWARCLEPESPDLSAWIRSGFHDVGPSLEVRSRGLEEALSTGLSRPPRATAPSRWVLADVARVVRGIATGANDFFFLTRARARELDLPEPVLTRAIGRTRDLPPDQDTVTLDTLDALEASGRPTVLLSLDATPPDALPASVRAWLEEGVRLGVPSRPLIARSRRPWYRMETRSPPAFLFAYLGRRHTRFLRNEAGVVPLTGFLCVYPHASDPASLEALWKILVHPETVANLSDVGKSYGSGAIKVEPRALERLALPDHVVEAAGLDIPHGPAHSPGWAPRRAPGVVSGNARRRPERT
ncbi:MAG: N-6 DNA methylase [Deltaproteobacteria bacterium]|nr:N-6 DNA methylase [Deltaproteobacteria bacterium]